MRVVLGVGAGIAAYKVCELLRLLTESGHQVRVVPTPDSLHFVGAATWEALSGQPVSASPWERRPRGSACPARAAGRSGLRRAGHRGPAGPRGRGPRPRPADQRPADRAVPGHVRARHAHRDVAASGHGGECRNAAVARGDGARAGLRATDWSRHGAWQAARARASLSSPHKECSPGAARALSAGPGRAARWRSRPAAPERRSIRSASSATGLPGGRATRWRGRGGAGREGHAGGGQRRLARPGRRRGGPGPLGPRRCARRCSPPRRTPTPSSWRRPSPTTGRRSGARTS